MNSIKHIMREYMLAFIGTWYSWAGNSPDGFDCSGFVVEVLKAVGLIKRGRWVDYTAQGLHDMFIDCKVSGPSFGCLALYWSRTGHRVVHVEICLDSALTLGASGGGSRTKTKEDAVRDNAFIKVRPINYGRGAVTFVDPFRKAV